MFFVSGVDAITPLARLEIEILPGGECTTGKKVGLDEPEHPFDARGTVCISAFMSYKSETKTLGKIKQGETAKFGSIGKANYWRLSKNPKEYEE